MITLYCIVKNKNMSTEVKCGKNQLKFIDDNIMYKKQLKNVIPYRKRVCNLEVTVFTPPLLLLLLE